MKSMAAILSVLTMLILFPTSVFAADSHVASERYFYLPPSWGEHVVFYHSFSQSVEQAEIPLPRSRVLNGQHGERVAGLTGYGFRSDSGKAALRSAASIGGAVLMGFGGMLAGGCAVGAGVSGSSIFSLTAWVALSSMWAGAALTDYLVDRKRILVISLPDMPQRASY